MKSGAVGRAIVVDARCLQDPDYARRGVGRHSLALLRHAPEGFRLIGLVDPCLPDLIEEASDAFDALRINAYAAHSGAAPNDRPVAYISLSPMTHDPLFGGRILADSALLRVGVVYDFIPRRHAARYLPGEVDRLDYAVRLRWLAACDLFAPNSQSTADDLVALLGVARRRVTVTGSPLDPAFECATSQAGLAQHRHILVVGGGDPRKNPEAVVRAHARSPTLQAARIPLLIAGNYGPDQAHALRGLSEASGGQPDLVEVSGHVEEQALVGFYRSARVVVCASRDEGFSLPVIEGMAAGAIVLVSDIPPHAELVPDAQRRFPADDDEAIATLLERAWSDEAWRRRVLAEQSQIWPRFRASEVASRFWAPLMARLGVPPSAPAVLHNRRPRVALLSPMPPDRSGVADYTAATCSELGRLVELHVFTETANPSPVPLAASVRPLDALPCLLPSFDRVVGVLGNSHFHLRIFELLQTYGAAIIAHDARMLSFYRIVLGENRAIAEASRELGRVVTPDELLTWLADESGLEALFLGEIASAAAPMIVHSPVTAELVEQRYDIKPVCLPFSIYRPWTPEELTKIDRAAARRRLNLPNENVVIATFGYIHPCKAPEECIWALEILRRWKVPASLHFVGGVENLEDGGEFLLNLAERIGVGEHVKIVGKYVSEQTYRDYLVGADLAIQLRTYHLGGLSGALLDCAAAGLPTVSNAALAKAVGVPRGYIRSIPDALSPLLLAEALAELVASGMCDIRPETQRREFSEQRSFRLYSELLCNALHLETAV